MNIADFELFMLVKYVMICACLVVDLFAMGSGVLAWKHWYVHELHDSITKALSFSEYQNIGFTL